MGRTTFATKRYGLTMVILETRLVMAGAILILCAAQSLQGQPTLPDFSSAVFSNSTTINNPYFPLVPGTVSTFNVQDIDLDTGETTSQLVVVEVLHDMRRIAGIDARVVRDRVFEDGLVREDTFDWYAQYDNDNGWYLGEDVTDFEYDDGGNLIGTSHPGAFEVGVNGAKPGYAVPANPQLGQHYYQEYYVGVAEDQAEVTGVNQSFVVPYGRFENGVLRTRDSTALEPNKYAHKFYALGVGPIAEREFTVGGDKLVATVDLNPRSILPAFDPRNFESGAPIDNRYFPVVAGTVYTYEGQELDRETGETIALTFRESQTSRTRDILGITAQIVRAVEFKDGVLVEDSDVYYAQDKVGNVWWMGESSTKFEYDDEGNLLGTNNDSTWIAGENEAKPGYYMPKDPSVGDSFYEIFSPNDEDLDHAEITSLSEAVSTVIGDLENVLIARESSDLEPGYFADKYYAPGVGLVLVREDFDELGSPGVVLELRRVGLIPEPASISLLVVGTMVTILVFRCRRT